MRLPQQYSPPVPEQNGLRASAEEALDSPVFVLSTARSGSTLLRFILDSHPLLACPPETGLASSCMTLARSLSTLDRVDPVLIKRGEAPESENAERIIRQGVDAAYSRYLREHGKQRWCDKSLDALFCTDFIVRMWPQVKFICLFRHCMDMIASGLEISPWGLNSFGFADHGAMFPGNSVAALGSYWVARTGLMLRAVETYTERCLMVRYEDLVFEPEQIISKIFSFLEVPQVPGIADACLRSPHDGTGRGDDKIRFTGRITTDSVGRGKSIPYDTLPEPIRNNANEALNQLDYCPVEENWNAPERPEEPRRNRAIASGGKPGEAFERAVALIGSRLSALSASTLSSVRESWPQLASRALVVAVHDRAGNQQEFTCADIEPSSQDTTPDAPAVLSADAAIWISVLENNRNPATDLVAGRMRCSVGTLGAPQAMHALHAIAALLGIATVPVAAGPVSPATTAVRPVANGTPVATVP
jgi:hypothetical protein